MRQLKGIFAFKPKLCILLFQYIKCFFQSCFFVLAFVNEFCAFKCEVTIDLEQEIEKKLQRWEKECSMIIIYFKGKINKKMKKLFRV